MNDGRTILIWGAVHPQTLIEGCACEWCMTKDRCAWCGEPTKETYCDELCAKLYDLHHRPSMSKRFSHARPTRTPGAHSAQQFHGDGLRVS